MQFLQGLIGMVLSFLLLVYRPKVKDFIGDIGFAERYLGSGGTWTFLALLGIFGFILSLMWATGTLQSSLLKLFSPFLP